MNPLKAEAEELHRSGLSQAQIAANLGVHRNTVRNWLNPEAYRKNLDHALRYTKAHPYRTRSREIKDKRNAYQRRMYASDPVFREKMHSAAKAFRSTEQGWIASSLRACVLGFSGRYVCIHREFMEAVTGMTKEQFTLQWDWPGTFDHIVPLCAFDLTKPEHVVRATHPSNLRLIPIKDNMAKGSSGRDVDVMALPWVGTEDALVRAAAFIARRLDYLRRRELKMNGQYGPIHAESSP